MTPRIITIDIETAPIEAHTWGIWDVNVGLEQIKTEWSIIAYAAKWLGAKEVIYKDTGGRGVAKVRDDTELLSEIWGLLDSADIVIAQNGKAFDIKKINARLAMAGFPPYSPIRVVDTVLVARRTFGFTSNKLAWLSKWLTSSKKSEHKKYPGFELWLECLKDNPKAWREMRKYNRQDVIATEELYLKLRPWIESHPNLGAYGKGLHACPKCGSKKTQSRGVLVTQQGNYQRFHCQTCGGWSRGKKQLLDIDTRKSLNV